MTPLTYYVKPGDSVGAPAARKENGWYSPEGELITTLSGDWVDRFIFHNWSSSLGTVNASTDYTVPTTDANGDGVYDLDGVTIAFTANVTEERYYEATFTTKSYGTFFWTTYNTTVTIAGSFVNTSGGTVTSITTTTEATTVTLYATGSVTITINIDVPDFATANSSYSVTHNGSSVISGGGGGEDVKNATAPFEVSGTVQVIATGGGLAGG